MSQKNPFEIRADILALAKDYMDKQHEANVDLIERMSQINNQTSDAIAEAYKMYTPEELLKQAETFYQQFVCKEK